ncbi:MAG: GvpL/GvpF family gas vesicle protein [Alphaproteobacteria bacterium]
MSAAAHNAAFVSSPPEGHDATDAVYVYGVVGRDAMAAGVAPPTEGIVPGVPVELLPAGDLAVVASRAPQTAFAPPETPETSTQDWATGRALAHHHVLAAMASLCTVAPVKFGALCRNMDDILALFERQGSKFARVLDRVAGAQEWGVKLFADMDASRTMAENTLAVATLKAEMTAASPGKAYFLRKKLDDAISEELREVLSRLSENIHGQLAALSKEATPNPAQQQLGAQLGSKSRLLILDASYLVAVNRTVELQQTVAHFAETLPAQGADLILTGPWPPYSFASVDTGGASDGPH